MATKQTREEELRQRVAYLVEKNDRTLQDLATRYGIQLDGQSLMAARLELLIDTAFDGAPEERAAFEVKWQEQIEENLEGIGKEVRKQALLTPLRPGGPVGPAQEGRSNG